MNEIVIYGAGGFGRETALLIRQINQDKPTWRIRGFCDDGIPEGKSIDDLKVLGGLKYLDQEANSLAVVIAVADPVTRKKIRTSLRDRDLQFPALVHPSVNVGDTLRNEIQEGAILAAGTVLTTNVKIHSFSIINLMCSLGHDCVLSEYSSVMPGVNLSGNVIIGTGCFIGTGARILPGVQLGNNCTVGAGAVVTSSFPSGSTLVGVPAKIMTPAREAGPSLSA